MSDRHYDFIIRLISVAAAAVVVGAITVALVAAAAASPRVGSESAVFFENIVLDAVAAPDSLAVTLFGLFFAGAGLMRYRRTV